MSRIEKPEGVGHFLIQKLSQNFDFCASPSQNVIKRDARGKKGKLSLCKCLFGYIKANLANIQLENLQNVQEICFWQKAPGGKGLIIHLKKYIYIFHPAWLGLQSCNACVQICKLQLVISSI